MSYEAITLALLSLRGVGPRTVQALWQKHPKMETTHDVADTLRAVAARGPAPTLGDVAEAFDDAQRLLDRCEQERIKVLGPQHRFFAPRLRAISNPPLLLFAMGDDACLLRNSIAVIGTREPTDFGKRSARKIAKGLAEDGWVIVSGLAEGCDTEGHEGCLSASGCTVAFLAHGFGRIYPASNKKLAERIAAEGGCLVTEYSPGQPPTRGAFVERDRLQSGLSLGIIVIETDIKGGTMHTVRHATEQGRPIAALSHPENLRTEPKTQGNLYLIAEKNATPLKDKEDVSRFAEMLRRGEGVKEPPTKPAKPAALIQGELTIP